MTRGERIRDYLRDHETVTGAKAKDVLAIRRNHAHDVLLEQWRAGVIVPVPGVFPRTYRLASAA